MADLNTHFLGLPLRNPVIVSSSGLTGSARGIRQCVEAGAAAVVIKSLFEEQIDVEVNGHGEKSELSSHPEATEYIQQMGKHLGPSNYLSLIETAKQENSVPIVASVNCVTSEWWANYARQIEKAGADAIELNIAIMPRELNEQSGVIEQRYVDIVREVRAQVKIPLAVKIGPYITALPALAGKLCQAGAQALVLFNRFYQLDIDIDNLSAAPGYQFSTPNEIYQPLRWIALLESQVDCELVGSTGVHSGREAIKLLLAGAQAVQVCTTLYANGLDRIAAICNEIAGWMDVHGFNRVDDFRGLVAKAARKDRPAFERLQYIKALTGVD